MYLLKRATAGLLLISSSLLTLSSFAEPHTFDFDKRHTEIHFEWDHLGASKNIGHFNDYEGSAIIDLEKPENSKVDIKIKTSSLNTGLAELDNELSKKDFFASEQHPTITFKSQSVKAVSPTQWKVEGDITIKGKTKPITLIATLNFSGKHPLGKFRKNLKDTYLIGFSAETYLFRSDFNMGKFSPLVSDLININIQAELTRKI
ncbi:MAG: YceI family protein [Cellvibrionaceae bacterium]